MALWTPADLGSSVVAHWYDISDTSSLTDVGSGVISVINDKSGNSRHLSQGTSGKRGTLTTSNTNVYSKQTISVPSGGGYPGTVAHAIPDAHSMLMDGGALNGGVTGGTTGPVSMPVTCIIGLHWQPGSSHGGTGEDSTYYWQNGVALAASFEPGTVTMTTGGCVMWIGRIKSSGVGNSVGRFFDSGSNGNWMNRTSDYARTADLDWGECVILTGTITTATRQKLEGYLSWKWAGDGSLLPSGHPYKSAAPTSGSTDALSPATNLRTTAWTPPTPGPIGQKHVVTATNHRATAWTPPTPTLGQKHVLTTGGIRTASPGLPTSLTLGGTLTVTNLRTSSPILGTPVINQVHVLTTTGKRTSALISGTPALGQKHVLTASNLRTTAPRLGPAYLNGALPIISSYIKRWIGMKVGQGSG